MWLQIFLMMAPEIKLEFIPAYSELESNYFQVKYSNSQFSLALPLVLFPSVRFILESQHTMTVLCVCF